MWTSRNTWAEWARDMEKYTQNNAKCLRAMCMNYDYVKIRLIRIRASTATCTEWPSYREAIYVYSSVIMSKYNSKCPFFPRHAANITMVFCSAGVDGAQLSHARSLPHPIHSMHEQGTAAGPPSDGTPALPSGLNPSSLKSWFKDSRASAFTTRQKYHPWDLPQESLLACL